MFPSMGTREMLYRRRNMNQLLGRTEKIRRTRLSSLSWAEFIICMKMRCSLISSFRRYFGNQKYWGSFLTSNSHIWVRSEIWKHQLSKMARKLIIKLRKSWMKETRVYQSISRHCLLLRTSILPRTVVCFSCFPDLWASKCKNNILASKKSHVPQMRTNYPELESK